MASKDHKIVRRAQAMTEMARLSGLLAEKLGIEAPVINAANRDAELAEIQRIEGINGLLNKVLEAENPDAPVKPAAKSTKHGAIKQ